MHFTAFVLDEEPEAFDPARFGVVPAHALEDRRRWTRLTAAGYQLAVLTHEDIEHAPEQTVRDVGRILALAAAA